MKTIAAFFDVDGTLFTGHVWRGMLDYFKVHAGKWAVRRFWYAHLPAYFLFKAKLFSEEQFRGPWGAHLAWLVKGWTPQQLQGLYDFIAHDYVVPHRREDTIERLQDHKAQGHVTVLVSTGFTDMIAAIGSTIGAQHAVGCDLAMKDGSFYTNEVFIHTLDEVKQRNTSLHLIGLLSEKSSHGSIEYPLALLRMAKANGLEKAPQAASSQ